jgi:uncharacterized protein YdeI (YjbR/CyaY-like superfamily)
MLLCNALTTFSIGSITLRMGPNSGLVTQRDDRCHPPAEQRRIGGNIEAIRQPMTDTKVLVKRRFATAAAWHNWLEKHHAGSRGLWLEFAKKENERPSITHAQALETSLCFGWIDGQTKSSADGWWCQRFTPRGPRSKWSQVNCAAVERLRAQGRLTAAGLEQMEAAKSDGRWSAAYAPQSTIIVPDDLKAALAASPIARNFFESLDSKNRYAILYRLHNAKKPETRERRLLKFVQMLKAGDTLHERPGKSARRAAQK